MGANILYHIRNYPFSDQTLPQKLTQLLPTPQKLVITQHYSLFPRSV